MMFGNNLLKSLATAAVLTVMAGGAQAAVVNFSDGIGDNSANTYIEDGFLFEGVQVVGGNCFDDPLTSPEKCAAENKSDLIRMTAVNGGAFDLMSIWFQILGKTGDADNAFKIYDAINNVTALFGQPTYDKNTGYTVLLTQFMGVTELFFSSSPDAGNLRIDNVNAAAVVPVPAAGLLLLGALGGLAALRRRRSV